jgi:hypothetical protein
LNPRFLHFKKRFQSIRAKKFRKLYHLSENLGTAVVVQVKLS